MNRLSYVFGFLFAQISWLPAQTYHTQEAPLPCLNKDFSVVVHVVRDTFGNLNINTDEINDRIVVLNELFKPICTRFVVCDLRFIDNFQYDDVADMEEWEEMLVKYHQPHRINLFFVRSSFGGQQECGFATPGGIRDVQSGGILVQKFDCIATGRHTLPHLMGHYFGLLHTFQGNGTELVNGSNCSTEGDEICDTPADPYREGQPLQSYLDPRIPCRFTFQGQDANDEYYRPDVGNLMSYYYDPMECRCAFSHHQFLRMANNYLDAPAKMW